MTSFVDGLHFRLRNDAYLKHDGTALTAGRLMFEEYPQPVQNAAVATFYTVAAVVLWLVVL